jgi:hypothetical protein
LRRLRHALGRVFQLLLAAVYRERAVVPLERLGTHYGGWWCSPGMLGPRQVALCAGAGEDISFDVALNANFGMRVLCVDPTPRAIAHVAGLLDAAATGSSYAVEGGAERGIDRLALLKLDIEGAEYAVLDEMLDGGVRPTQVLVEFDELHLPLSPLAVLRVGRRVRRLRAAGYALVMTERTNFVFARRAPLVQPA